MTHSIKYSETLAFLRSLPAIYDVVVRETDMVMGIPQLLPTAMLASPTVMSEIRALQYAERMKTKVVRRSALRAHHDKIHPEFPFALLPPDEPMVKAYAFDYREMFVKSTRPDVTLLSVHEDYYNAFGDLQKWLHGKLKDLDQPRPA